MMVLSNIVKFSNASPFGKTNGEMPNVQPTVMLSVTTHMMTVTLAQNPSTVPKLNKLPSMFSTGITPTEMTN